EGALLRKEKRKSGEIDLSGIDFRLGEVGVRSKNCHELRSHLPCDFSSDCALPGAICSLKLCCGATGNVRAQFEPTALLQFTHTSESTRSAEVIDRGIKCR